MLNYQSNIWTHLTELMYVRMNIVWFIAYASMPEFSWRQKCWLDKASAQQTRNYTVKKIPKCLILEYMFNTKLHCKKEFKIKYTFFKGGRGVS